jgi:hypothetical protein
MSRIHSGAKTTASRTAGGSKQRPNLLLAMVPDAERVRLTARCEPVELSFGEVLCQQGSRIRHVYFPTGGFISLLAQFNKRLGLEVGLVGVEGAVGIAVALGVGVLSRACDRARHWLRAPDGVGAVLQRARPQPGAEASDAPLRIRTHESARRHGRLRARYLRTDAAIVVNPVMAGV